MRRWLPILLLVTLAACREPLSTERFIRGEGPFVFPVDMSDTTAAYDFDLYTRVDAMDIPSSVPLRMSWTSPSDSLYTETVYLPLQGRHGVFSMDVYQAYRADMRPVEAGEWTLTVSALSQLPEGFRGLGLVVRKNK